MLCGVSFGINDNLSFLSKPATLRELKEYNEADDGRRALFSLSLNWGAISGEMMRIASSLVGSSSVGGKVKTVNRRKQIDHFRTMDGEGKFFHVPRDNKINQF